MSDNRGETAASFFAQDETLSDEAQDPSTAAKSVVPADDAITKCRICGEPFDKIWDEEEEEWMYQNAVYGVVQNATPGGSNKESIFHQHCYKAAMGPTAGGVELNQLAPGTPNSPDQRALRSRTRSWSDNARAMAAKRGSENPAEDPAVVTKKPKL